MKGFRHLDRIALVVIWLLLALLVGCGGQPPEVVTPAATATAFPTIAVPPATEETPAVGEAAPTATPASTAEVSFSGDVLPILQSRCVSCHGSTRSSGGLRLDSYTAVMAGARSGAVVEAGNAASSLLVDVVSTGRMPPSGQGLSAEEIQIIIDWIDAGALDN